VRHQHRRPRPYSARSNRHRPKHPKQLPHRRDRHYEQRGARHTPYRRTVLGRKKHEPHQVQVGVLHPRNKRPHRRNNHFGVFFFY